MPLLHGGTPFCKQQSISSWINNIPGSFPFTSGSLAIRFLGND
jgi:hypothetical protein